MTDEKRYLLKLISILLQYPDDEFILSLEELKEAVAQVPQVEQRQRCVSFLDYLGNNSLIRLQEEYTSTFDLNPETCLNLTYHRWGDARERGSALVEFHQLYGTTGYESSTGELPDYLPLILEFLSINRQEKQVSFLGQYSDQVEVISSRLQEAGSPHSGLFEIVFDIFRELQANGV